MNLFSCDNVQVSALIEREGPQRRTTELFPGADPERARAHFREMEPFLYQPASDRIFNTYQSFLVRVARPDDPDRHLRRREQGPAAAVRRLSEDAVAGGAGGGGTVVRPDRCRHLHAPARRPRRLEHPPRRRPLGTDVSERQVRVRPGRMRILGRAGEQGRRPRRAHLDGQLPAVDPRPVAPSWWRRTRGSAPTCGSVRLRDTHRACSA